RAVHQSRHHCEAAWWVDRSRDAAGRVHRNQGDFAAHARVTSLNGRNHPGVRFWPKADMPVCPLSGVKRTWIRETTTSANDPKRTCRLTCETLSRWTLEPIPCVFLSLREAACGGGSSSK